MASQRPRHSEPSANNELGDLLRAMLAGCLVRSENTQLIEGRPGLQLDNLVTAADRAPVVVEAEYEASGNAEGDASARLGLPVVDEIHPIEAAIALRYPDTVRFADNLRDALTAARLSYAVLYQDGRRFPESGWLQGGVADLADLIRLESVPQQAVDAAANALQQGIDRVSTILDDLDARRPRVTAEIAGLLGMVNVPQTRRMAVAIIANAMVFHERIAGTHDGIPILRHTCGPDVATPQDATLSAWQSILEINYWPIFAIGKDILEQLPMEPAARVLRTLYATVGEVQQAGVDNAHDLTGRVFQRLIADRKYLATFYTLPASAALLARLAVAKLSTPVGANNYSPLHGTDERPFDWANPHAIAQLRVGDFACGTGALLSAVYEQIAARHERAGGDSAKLHPAMMEEVLYGCDVMPSAAHITSATLSGAQPTVGYGKSRIYTMPYGRQPDGSVKIGSLEGLAGDSQLVMINTSDPARRTGSAGEETVAHMLVEIPDDYFDLVIMNPPFTRAGSDWEGSSRNEDYVKQFRGLATDLDTQKDMARRLSQFTKGTCYHGYAGIASAFVALGDRKIKPGGVLALVLPLSAAAGLSWQGFRQLLADNYTDLEVLSIAANGNDMSFSSDTGMAECLVVARKTDPNRHPDTPSRRSRESGNPGPAIRFTSLRNRPAGFAQAAAMATNIAVQDSIRGITDGPYGGAQLTIGDDLAGEMLAAPQSGDGEHWGSVRLLDYSLAQTAYALAESKLWLPGQAAPVTLPIAPLTKIGNRGWHDINIAGSKAPFTKIAPSPTATYPSLWNHDAKQETRIVCQPDSQLQVRQGMESKAAEVWTTASRAHLNRDFTFGSQPLCVAFTEQESIGGRVWPNVSFDDKRFDYAFAIWGNSTLGLLSYWWHASRQQSSKAGMTVSAAESLPVLDLRTLTDAQLAIAATIFNDFRAQDLQPAYLADADPNRALLDRRVVCDLLGFDDTIYQAVRRLSAKWTAEPSVHGGKRRPRGAGLAV